MESGLSAEAGIKADVGIFKAVVNLFTNLRTQLLTESENKHLLESSMQIYFSEFLEISNQILFTINKNLREKDKMLLLIIDGLDKVLEEYANEIFLSQTTFLTQLQCSMIVTFPIYLKYSPNVRLAERKYAASYMLSMIKVHERDNSPNPVGIEAMKQIIDKRMDIDKLIEDRKKLEEVILLSGGNIRDLFRLISIAAENARGTGEKSRIRNIDFDIAINHQISDFRRRFTKSFLQVLKEVYEDASKEKVISDNPKDDTLQTLFGTGLLVEYDGRRWCDLHPLARIVLENLIEAGQ